MSMRACALLLAAACLFGTSALAEKKAYTMQDLEALVKSESWQELMVHLEDIAPAERNKKWQRIVEQTGRGLLKGAKKDNDPFAGLVMADELTKRFAFLKKSRPFMDERAQIGLDGFARCYQMSYDGGVCNQRIVPFVEADQGNVKLALKAGQLVMRNQNHYFAIPLFRLGVVWAKGAKAACTADRLAEAVDSALGQNPKQALAAHARETATTCWAFMRKALLATLAKSEGSTTKNICAVLKAKKVSKAKCK